MADGEVFTGREDFARRLIRVGSGTLCFGRKVGELEGLSTDCSWIFGGFVVARDRNGDTFRFCLRAFRYFGVSCAGGNSVSSFKDCVV